MTARQIRTCVAIGAVALVAAAAVASGGAAAILKYRNEMVHLTRQHVLLVLYSGGPAIVVGVLALVSSRWPLTSERWGYVAMSSLAALWAAFYALAILLLDAPRGGVYGVIVWGLVAFLWWGISGLRNPEDVLTRATTTEGA